MTPADLARILSRKEPPRRQLRCRKKKLYLTYEGAIAALKTIEQSPTKTVKYPKRVYYCKACAGYHLSSLTKDEYLRQITPNIQY